MKKIIFMVAALMGFTFVSAQTNVVDTYNQSVQALGAKDYAKAAELLEAVIADGDGEEDEAIMGCVENAKKNLPAAYQGMGLRAAGAAMKAQKPEEKDAKFAEALSYLDKAKAKAKAFNQARALATATAAAADTPNSSSTALTSSESSRTVRVLSSSTIANTFSDAILFSSNKINFVFNLRLIRPERRSPYLRWPVLHVQMQRSEH